MNIKIIVATHKPYTMPADKMYMPVHVGRAISADWQQTGLAQYAGDDTGENISSKNKNYCELTARKLSNHATALSWIKLSSQTIISISILILSIALLVGATNNAFIYTRF